MLDIFDECNDAKSEYGNTGVFTKEEPTFEKNSFVDDGFLMQEEEAIQEEISENNNMMILSRKGSGVEAHALDSRLGFVYQTDLCHPTDKTDFTSNSEIGAALTPNEDLKETFTRRPTRISDSEKDKDVFLEGRLFRKIECGRDKKRKKESKFGSVGVEEMLNEKFDYKKYVNQELAKLGNICG